MKIDIKGILTGAFNSVFVQDSIEKVAEERLAICEVCPDQSENKKKKGYDTFRPDVHCTLCGCNLHMKTRALSQECPVSKWKAEISTEEEIELDKKLDGKQEDS